MLLLFFELLVQQIVPAELKAAFLQRSRQIHGPCIAFSLSAKWGDPVVNVELAFHFLDSTLLEKDPRWRPTWPQFLSILSWRKKFYSGKTYIKYNPFVVKVANFIDSSSPSLLIPQLPLTTALTASQELAKEIQRQDLSQKMPFKNKWYLSFINVI